MRWSVVISLLFENLGSLHFDVCAIDVFHLLVHDFVHLFLALAHDLAQLLV